MTILSQQQLICVVDAGVGLNLHVRVQRSDVATSGAMAAIENVHSRTIEGGARVQVHGSSIALCHKVPGVLFLCSCRMLRPPAVYPRHPRKLRL